MLHARLAACGRVVSPQARTGCRELLALGRHEPYLPIIGLVLGAPAQAVGATVGYQLTRRER